MKIRGFKLKFKSRGMILKAANYAKGLALQRHFPTLSRDFTLQNWKAIKTLFCCQLSQSEVINPVTCVTREEALQHLLLRLPCSTWGNFIGLTVSLTKRLKFKWLMSLAFVMKSETQLPRGWVSLVWTAQTQKCPDFIFFQILEFWCIYHGPPYGWNPSPKSLLVFHIHHTAWAEGNFIQCT